MNQLNNPQSKERIRLTLLVLLLMALVLGSFWILKIVEQGSSDEDKQLAKGKADYYIHQFRYIRMQENGTPRYDLTGDVTTHYPDSQNYLVTSPKMTSFDPKQGKVTVVADRAVITNHHSEIHLYDNVNLDRPAFDGKPHLHVQSAYLLALPDEDIVKTDKPVMMTMDTSVLNGTGMIVNNKTQEFRLLNQVRGTYYDTSRQTAR